MLPFKLVLTVLFFGLLIYTVFGLYVIFQGGHKVYSFNTAFFGLSFVWTLLRSVFWLGTLGAFRLNTKSGDVLFVSFWLPFTLQFSVFSLVVLFYVRILARNAWRAKRSLLCTIYAVANAVLAALSVTLAVLAGHAGSHHMVESLQSAFLLFAGGLFALLSASILVSGILLPRMDSYASQGIFRFDARVMLFVNSVLAAIFLARAIFNALTALRRINGVTIPVTSADDASVWAFLLMTLFEVMPTSLLLATTARLPSSPGLFGTRMPATALLRARPAPSGGNYDAAVHPQPTFLFGSSDGDSSGHLSPDDEGIDDNWPADGSGGGGGIYDNARRYDSDDLDDDGLLDEGMSGAGGGRGLGGRLPRAPLPGSCSPAAGLLPQQADEHSFDAHPFSSAAGAALSRTYDMVGSR